MRKWVSAIFLIVAATAVAAAQDLSSFQAAAERMATALKSGDVETISQMYAEDARILPPGRDIIQGREAIKAFWTEDIKGMTDMALTTVDVKGLGDSDVREIGQFSGKPQVTIRRILLGNTSPFGTRPVTAGRLPTTSGT